MKVRCIAQEYVKSENEYEPSTVSTFMVIDDGEQATFRIRSGKPKINTNYDLVLKSWTVENGKIVTKFNLTKIAVVLIPDVIFV